MSGAARPPEGEPLLSWLPPKDLQRTNAERQQTQGMLQQFVELVVQRADQAGFVLTVEQVPELPLAMGNYRTRVQVRAKRGA